MLIILHLAAVAGYAASRRLSLLFWPAAAAHLLTLAAHSSIAPRFDFGMSASSFMLAAAAVGRMRSPRPLPQTTLAVLAAAASLAPLWFEAPKPLPTAAAWAHIAPAALAYAFALSAALQSADLWLAERRRRALADSGAPPLLSLEDASFRDIAAAFLLLSLALVSGALLGADGGAPAHKIVFAVLSWLVFGGLLLGRRIRGWRGRTARAWLAAGLLFLILSYFGTHFVLQVILGRIA